MTKLALEQQINWKFDSIHCAPSSLLNISLDWYLYIFPFCLFLFFSTTIQHFKPKQCQTNSCLSGPCDASLSIISDKQFRLPSDTSSTEFQFRWHQFRNVKELWTSSKSFQLFSSKSTWTYLILHARGNNSPLSRTKSKRINSISIGERRRTGEHISLKQFISVPF